MIPTVSLVFLCDNDFESTAFYFEKLGVTREEIKKEVTFPDDVPQYQYRVHGYLAEIVVGIPNEKDTIDRFQNYFADKADVVYNFSNNITRGAAYNAMFRNCTSTYVCVVHPRVVLQKDWLGSLMEYADNVKNTGLVAVPPNTAHCKLTALLQCNEERFSTVLVPEIDFVIPDNTACIFFRQLLYFVGAFDASQELSAVVVEHWAQRAQAMGKNNFYIPDRYALAMKKKSADLQHMHRSIEEMRMAKNFYLPL